MKKHILTSLFMLAVLHPVTAEDLTLTDGRVLHDVEVLGTGTDTLKVRYRDGVTSVYGNKLPDEWQKKYKLTSEDVQARLDDIQKQQEEQRQLKKDSLATANKVPRYLSANDVKQLFTLFGDMSSLEATATALRWNHLEAKRMGNDELAATYLNDWNALQPQLVALANKKAQLELMKEQENLQERENLASTLKETQDAIKAQTLRTSQLENTLREAQNQPPVTTTIIAPPVYTYNNNTTIIRPRPRPPVCPDHRPGFYPPNRPGPTVKPTPPPFIKANNGQRIFTPNSRPAQIIKNNNGDRVFTK